MLIQREGETQTYVGRRGILALRMTVTRLDKMLILMGIFTLNHTKDSRKNYSLNDWNVELTFPGVD